VYHEQHVEAFRADPLEHTLALAHTHTHTLMLTGYVTGNVTCVSKH
jgi:hypothetical protein